MGKFKAFLGKVADWLDDRWTWAAIGLITGYFGFGSSDAAEWQAWQEVGIAVASLILILVRDKKRRAPDGKEIVNEILNHAAVTKPSDPVSRTPDRLRESMSPEFDPKIDGHGFGDK
jgi:hypothetical protein